MKLKLRNVRFSHNTKLDNIDWGDYVIKDEREGEIKGQHQCLGWAEDIYRRLKAWYTEHGIYNIACKFFYREMEAKMKSQSWKKSQQRKGFPDGFVGWKISAVSDCYYYFRYDRLASV